MAKKSNNRPAGGKSGAMSSTTRLFLAGACAEVYLLTVYRFYVKGSHSMLVAWYNTYLPAIMWVGLGVLLLGLGCENSGIEQIRPWMGDYDESRIRFLVCQETEDELETGIRLLEDAKQHDFIILDEIGGFEMLSDTFLKALMETLESGLPCIGVMKGAGPASKMIQKLGLGDAYVQRAEELRRWMRQDENTLLYECAQFDPEGLRLARQWRKLHKIG